MTYCQSNPFLDQLILVQESETEVVITLIAFKCVVCGHKFCCFGF